MPSQGGSEKSAAMGRSDGKSGPGGSPPPLPDRAEGTMDPDQVDPRGASRQYAGTNQGCSMSIETTRPAPAGAPGALPRAESAATYNDKVVHQFTVATVFWGIVGMGVGVFIAAQLYWPALNFDIPWLSYGPLRPLHTNGVIFAFGGAVLFATSLYGIGRAHAELQSLMCSSYAVSCLK